MAISNIGAKETLTMKLTTAAKAVVAALDDPAKDAVGLAVTVPAAANEVGFGSSTGSAIFGVIETYDKKTNLAAVQVSGVVEAQLKAALTMGDKLGCDDSGKVVKLAAGTKGVLLAQDGTALVAEVLL